MHMLQVVLLVRIYEVHTETLRVELTPPHTHENHSAMKMVAETGVHTRQAHEMSLL